MTDNTARGSATPFCYEPALLCRKFNTQLLGKLEKISTVLT